MRSGNLRHRITFQHKTQVRSGETLSHQWRPAVSDDGQTMANIPAEVLTGPGRELTAAGATHAEVAARINLRWFPGLKAAWRILHDGSIYDITATSTDRTGRREWRLVCKTGVSDG